MNTPEKMLQLCDQTIQEKENHDQEFLKNYGQQPNLLSIKTKHTLAKAKGYLPCFYLEMALILSPIIISPIIMYAFYTMLS